MIEIFLVCQVTVVMVVGFVALKLLYEIREVQLIILAAVVDLDANRSVPVATPANDKPCSGG